MRSCDIF